MRRRRRRCCANVDTARKVTIARAVRQQGSESRNGETNRDEQVVSGGTRDAPVSTCIHHVWEHECPDDFVDRLCFGASTGHRP